MLALLAAAALVIAPGCTAAPAPAAQCASPLRLAAFKEVTAFLLDAVQAAGLPLDVQYVKSADEAHTDLMSGGEMMSPARR